MAQHGAAALPLFGMDKHKATTDSVWSASWAVVIAAFDKYLRYYVWSLGVLATNLVGSWFLFFPNNSCLVLVCYCMYYICIALYVCMYVHMYIHE